MKLRSTLSNTLFIGTLILIGSIFGLVLGVIFYNNFLPPWKTIEIISAHRDGIDILFVDYHSTEDNPTDDVLYIKTQSGDIYSVLHNEWSSIPLLPDGKTISEIMRRDGYDDSPIVAITTQNEVFQLVANKWEVLENPIEPFWGMKPRQCANWRKRLSFRKVIDSSGVSFAHALADSTKCYVLFANGDLEVWTRTQDAFSLIGTLGISALIGIGVVGAVGFKVKRSRNKNIVNEGIIYDTKSIRLHHHRRGAQWTGRRGVSCEAG